MSLRCQKKKKKDICMFENGGNAPKMYISCRYSLKRMPYPVYPGISKLMELIVHYHSPFRRNVLCVYAEDQHGTFDVL